MELIGKCMTMCPIKEVNFRKKHNLLHVLETSKINSALKLVEICVKEFHRSAAGEKTVFDVESLRPSSVLLITTEHLLGNILHQEEFSFAIRYDFIFNRLRSVRQDATIQRLAEVDPNTQVTLLERCVRFYIYATHQRRIDQRLNFDLHINTTHLNDCFQSLFRLYSCHAPSSPVKLFYDCSSVTAAYILLNLRSPQALHVVFSRYPKWLRAVPEINFAVRMYFAYQFNNFVLFNKLSLEMIKQKQYLPTYALSISVDDIRSTVIVMLCHSHNSKHLLFSCDDLICWLLLSSTKDIVTYLRKCGLSVVNGNSVQFLKVHKFPESAPCQVAGCKIFKSLNNIENEEFRNFLLYRLTSLPV